MTSLLFSCDVTFQLEKKTYGSIPVLLVSLDQLIQGSTGRYLTAAYYKEHLFVGSRKVSLAEFIKELQEERKSKAEEVEARRLSAALMSEEGEVHEADWMSRAIDSPNESFDDFGD